MREEADRRQETLPEEGGAEASPANVVPAPGETHPPKKRSLAGRIFGWLFGLVGGFVLLLVLLTLLLYIPSVQTYVVNTTLSKLEKTLGMRITAGDVRIGFPLKVRISDVTGLDAEGDTLAVVGRLTADVSLLPILQGSDLPVGGIELSGAKVDYVFPNDSLFLKGTIGELRGDFFSYKLTEQVMSLRNISLKDGDMAVVALIDTVPKPDTGEKSRLVIYLDEAEIENVRGSFSTSLDSLIVDAYIEKASLRDGEVNIWHNYYQARHLSLKGEVYKAGPVISFLPYPWKVEADGDNPRYGGPYDIHGRINHLMYELGDGWAVRDASFTVDKDSLRGVAKDLSIRLNQSALSGEADLPFDEWVPAKEGRASFNLSGVIYVKELERFIGSTEAYPQEPIEVAAKGNGSIDGELLVTASARNEALLELFADGRVFGLFDEEKRDISGSYDLYTKEGTMGSVRNFLDVQNEAPAKYGWTIPGGMELHGTGGYGADKVYADFALDAARGTLRGKGEFGLKSKAYSADLDFRDLDIEQFLPGDTLGILSGTLTARGAGTDLYAGSTRSDFLLLLDSLLFKDQTFREVRLEGTFADNHLAASLDADHKALRMNTLLNGLFIRDNVDLNLALKVDTVIPSMLGIKSSILQGARFDLMTDLRTDFKERYELRGRFENFFLNTDKALITPTDTYLTADTDSEHIEAEIKSGDLLLNLTAENGLNDFTKRLSKVSEVVTATLKDSIAEKINMASWMSHYPTMALSFRMGRNNALRSYLDRYRIGAQSAALTLSTRTGEGLKGEGFVKMFQKDTLRIDGLDLVLNQDSNFFYALASAHKERFRNQAPFDLIASVTSNVRRSEADINWLDDKGEPYIRFGLGIWNEPSGDLKVDFTPEPIVLAYYPLTVAGENYIILPKENRLHVRADMRLQSPDGGEIYLHDAPSDEGHLLKADIRSLRLSGLEGIQFLPSFAGALTADAEWLQTDDGSLYTVDGSVDDFFFEKKEIGDLRLTASAKQGEAGMQAEADVILDDVNVAKGKYFGPKAEGAEPLIALTLDRFPLSKANPFLPKGLFTLDGLASGELSNFEEGLFSSGDLALARPRPMTGYIRLSEGDLFVPMLNETYRTDSKRIEITDGLLRLEDYGFTANGGRLATNGTVGLSGKFPLDLRIQARDMTILESQPSPEAMFYGLVNANLNLTARGPVDALDLSGYVGLLGSTNVTYITPNSELENKNGYTGLVRFTDFSDTLFVARRQAPADSLTFGGANLDFNIHIDPAAELTLLLDREGSNQVQAKGGGDLRFTIPPYGEMQLTGMYEISGGSVNLKVEPISKRFEIDRGSSLVWTGELLKPEINFSATARVNSRVSTAGENPRMVAFDVSVIAENSLDDLKLRFEAKAPEDLAVSNQLLAMNEQEMTRQSALLLTTGMFLGSGAGSFPAGGGNNLLGNALTSLLASQINSFAGDALDAQINFGINDATTLEGAGTNYSYSIAKSFLNDRINVVVGGKVMTGVAAYGTEQTFIDNMSLEYQLDEAGTHYLRLFHNKNYENLLDGEVIETGLGYVMRRRFNTLKELFDFRGLRADPIILPKKTDPSAQKDSVPGSPGVPAEAKTDDKPRNTPDTDGEKIDYRTEDTPENRPR